MTRLRVVVIGLVLVGGAAAAALLDPAARVQGWVGGEPFFEGRSATAWRRDLQQPDETTPQDAMGKLARGGAAAVPVCGWLIEHAESADVRRRAVDVLMAMPADVMATVGPHLVQALGDPDPLIRGVAVRAVGKHTPDAPGAVGKLADLFPDREAIRAVAAYGRRGGDAVPKLIPLLSNESDDIRRQAARALGKTGPAAKAAVPELIRTMNTDPVPGVREQSAEAFGEIGPDAAEAVPHLIKALKDQDAMVRRDAVRSLGQLGPVAKAALADVTALASDPDKRVKEAATTAARKIDPSGK